MFQKLLGISLCLAAANAIPTRESTWPEDLSTPFPYPTPSPINLLSAQAVNACVPTDFRISISESDVHCLTNTGYSVSVTVPNPTAVHTVLTGGFLKTPYIFERLDYFWTQNLNQNAANSIDGVGAPVFAAIIFRNTEYPTLAEAIQHRDGLAIVEVNVRVEGFVPNPSFEPFCHQLSQIQNAGSSIESDSIPLYIWLQTSTIVSNTYIYPGSYVDLQNGRRRYDCATVFAVPRDFQPCISIPQFEAFQQVRNGAGLPYSNTLTSQPRGIRPVIRGSTAVIQLSA